MVRLPQGKEEIIDRLDNLCLVVDHQRPPIASLCRTREKHTTMNQEVLFRFNS